MVDSQFCRNGMSRDKKARCKRVIEMIKEIIEKNRKENDEIIRIYNDFYESAKEDAEGRRLFKSLYQKANDYIECKRRWECLSEIEACKINGERSELHEILIQAFQEMLEYTEKQGKKHSKNTFDWNRNNIAAFADELVSRKEDLGERIHIIEALQWAQNHSEQIIEVIEGAEDYYDARAKVMKTFGFDHTQAQSVTEMRVRAFCEIEKEKLSGELQKFRGKMELFQE